MKIKSLLHAILNNDAASGYVLLGCTAGSLLLANLPANDFWSSFWTLKLGSHSLVQWINDGLMAIFFLLVGLELKREILFGQLKDRQAALLPIFAAIGGMVLPAGIYLLSTYGTGVENGFGIPMSTDIAFVIGILAMLGNRVPPALKIFLTALAVIDDMGAILVIALFYTSDLNILYLIAALLITGLLLFLNRVKKVHSNAPYLLSGIILWLLILQSGIHASIAGILLALTIPSADGSSHAPAARLQHALHKPVYFLILPLFVLANTAIPLAQTNMIELIAVPQNAGIMAGLLLGKPLGIVLGAASATAIKWGKLSPSLRWQHVIGGGALGGIGFTMSIFIATLAFDSAMLVNSAKIAILISSGLAALAGSLILLAGTSARTPANH